MKIKFEGINERLDKSLEQTADEDIRRDHGQISNENNFVTYHADKVHISNDINSRDPFRLTF